MASSLTTYEEENLMFFVDKDSSKTVVNNAEHGNMIESLKHTTDNLRNPFTDLYHWVKGEIYDLSAFQATLIELKSVGDGVEAVRNKIKQTKSDVDNIQSGKKTMRTLTKGSGDVHSIQSKLEQYERDLDQQIKLYDCLRVYLGQTVLPRFK